MDIMNDSNVFILPKDYRLVEAHVASAEACDL